MKYIFLALFTVALAGCTLSFQTISTEGEASDLVDENQATTPTVSTTASVTPK